MLARSSSNKKTCFEPGVRGSLHTKTNHLSFYNSPPSSEIDIETFEDYGIARLQVLRRIDVLRARGVTGDKLANEVLKLDSKYFPPTKASRLEANIQTKDYFSHSILRMVYCETEELRRWFLSNECQLFNLRFHNTNKFQVNVFLKEQGLLNPPISDTEKERLKSKLTGASSDTTTFVDYDTTEYYKVPFTEVLSLISRREVYLEAGFAYVSIKNIFSIIEGKFRTSLSRSLTHANKMKHVWRNDIRIASIIDHLIKIAFRFGGSISDNITANGLDAKAVVHIFVDYLTTVMGHSDPRTKSAGSKMFVSVGTKKPNTCDKTCPIAGREHKSNTQKYKIYFDTLVMEQGCWDGVCQATDKHVYYQILTGNDDNKSANPRCVRVGWIPPPPIGGCSHNVAPQSGAGDMKT